MVIFPCAKINIGLRIINKREDGYHNLESIFYPIGLCDILEIVKSNQFSFTQSGIVVSGDIQDNLVVSAYKLMQRKYGIGAVSIHLHKVIPTGAGLGGGSADASFTLKLLNTLFELNLSDADLISLALELGSDCPFFIYSTPCLVTGRGEYLNKIDFNLTDYWIKLVNPGIHIPTAQAFSKIVLNPNESYSQSTNKHFSVENLNRFKNDFEQPLFPQYPILSKIKDELNSEGAIYTSMSGSGSSIYGFFKEEPSKSDNDYFQYIGKMTF